MVQGDSVPKEFIPKLVDLVVEGKFPIEKMITFYDLSDINRAAQESSAASTIKPVLRMPGARIIYDVVMLREGPPLRGR